MVGNAAVDWQSVTSVRPLILEENLRPLARAFGVDRREHLETLLSLRDDERRILAREAKLQSIFGQLAVKLYTEEKRIPEALELFDAAVEAPARNLSILCNALWAVADHNHHLGVMKDRAEVYLARALPRGPKNPGIYHNAVCVLLELGDRREAIECVRQAVRWGYTGLQELKNDSWISELHGDQEFVAAFDDAALLAMGRERVLPEPLVRLASLLREGAAEESEIDFSMEGRFQTPDETREWLAPWTGREDPPFESLRAFGEDGTGGTACIWRRRPDQPMAKEAVVFFGSEGVAGVVARDLPDFLALFAAGIGPMEAVEHHATTGEAVSAVQQLLREMAPGAVERTTEQIRADAALLAGEFDAAFRSGS
jgi:hypothetical protein